MADLLDALTDTLTDKEKETLRLIVRGHDAKTAARELGLSVHTINERLRAARRKLDVTSSREAARILLESEAEASETAPENLVYAGLGDAPAPPASQDLPVTAFRSNGALWTGGIIAMSLLAATLALALAGAPATDTVGQPAPPETAARLGEFETSAREWLALADTSDWRGTYDAASTTFREGATFDAWQSAAQAREGLGAIVRRTPEQINVIQSSGKDYQVILFRSDFANREGVLERVTLEYQEGAFRVSGYWLDPSAVADLDAERESAARQWLALVDRSDWEASYAAARSAFRDANTLANWRDASQQARVPLGALISRKAVGFADVPSNEGYQVVRFETDFENRRGVIETVSLQREDGVLKVAGYYIN